MIEDHFERWSSVSEIKIIFVKIEFLLRFSFCLLLIIIVLKLKLFFAEKIRVIKYCDKEKPFSVRSDYQKDS